MCFVFFSFLQIIFLESLRIKKIEHVAVQINLKKGLGEKMFSLEFVFKRRDVVDEEMYSSWRKKTLQGGGGGIG